MDLYYVLTGLILGITAGIVPGPLMALLISETLKGNLKNGILISITPAITDIPIIIFFLIFYKSFTDINIIIKISSIFGSLALFYYGYKDLIYKKENIKLKYETSKTLQKGIIVNILNPHAYIFWGLIGVPQILKASLPESFVFVISFFIGICLTMFLIALLTAKSKQFLESKYYIFLIKLSGIFLIGFGFYILLTGLKS